ncbi:hypothetical protein FEF34_02400 [Streptomyces marianii]|uniref:Uncharacterized protein n=1 Tax=Streptomyces marianii TaxID=1817406 RepID=A0A5R9E1L5_9ACTN|nr:hypothetical protein FEF34_02400 [Streptomyces marianii]
MGVPVGTPSPAANGGCHSRRRAAGSRSATCRVTASTPGRASRSRERTEAWRDRAGSTQGAPAPELDHHAAQSVRLCGSKRVRLAPAAGSPRRRAPPAPVPARTSLRAPAESPRPASARTGGTPRGRCSGRRPQDRGRIMRRWLRRRS